VFIAAQTGHDDAIGTLVEHGADVNTASNDGYTPVFVAALRGHVDAIITLVEHGADVNTASNDGGTPVLAAAQKGHAGVIKLLYKLGANMKPTSFELSMTEIAKERNHTEALQLIDKILIKLTKECAFCGCSDRRVKKCSKCEKVRYCSRECQLHDHKKHKISCKYSQVVPANTATI
jgi:hypothetical protein